MKVCRLLLLFIYLVCLGFKSIAGPLVLLNQTDLNHVKISLQNGTADAVTLKAYELLIEQADAALLLDGFSVVNKTILPPSNDIHDYLSISRYWWPDTTKNDGLPWVRRDGVTNPDTQTDHVDRKRLGLMSKYVHILALAYYFSDDDRYAQKGTDFIERWFLSPETKMNPHLEFAQSIPGIDIKRRSGILDGRLIPEKVLDAITLFTPSKHWTAQNNQNMNRWLTDYLNWLTDSSLGQAGSKQTNNHGSWYFFQVTALSWYLEDFKGLEQAIKNTKRHMVEQFDKFGAQQHELERTRPYFYSCFNLEALTSIAVITEKVGDSLWQYPTIENSVLSNGVEYLIPAANGQPWKHGLSPIKTTDLIEVLDRYNLYSGKTPQIALLKHLLNSSKEKQPNSALHYRFRLLNPEVLLK